MTPDIFATMLEEPKIKTPETTEVDVRDQQEIAEKLRQDTLAIRYSCRKFGITKTLTLAQKERAASPFNANKNAISANKKIVNSANPLWKAVMSTMSGAEQYWKALTIPYPDRGIRLIRRDRLQEFRDRFSEYQIELGNRVYELQSGFSGIMLDAAERLGELYNKEDYPKDLSYSFEMIVEPISIEPPNYLKDLHPDLYRETQQRIAARFNASVSMAEAAFTQELQTIVSHLIERLSTNDGEKKKAFRNSAINNIIGFFDQFQTMNLGSSAELERLVGQAKNIVAGVNLDDLRENQGLAASIRGEMDKVKEQLDGMIIEKAGRAIRFEDE